MISEVMRISLFDVYFSIRVKTGWLADCAEAGFSKEWIEHLEKIDDEFRSYNPDDEIEAWVRVIEREGGPDISFEESDQQKIRILSKHIADIYQRYERSMWADEPYADRAIMLALSGIDRMEKLRRGIRGRQLHCDEMRKHDADGFVSDRITDQDIERARVYPLEKLVPDFDMAKHGYIECKWHEDKRPSMLIKNGFGYCFTCAKSIDSIGWLMEQENMKFVDAVKYLRGKI